MIKLAQEVRRCRLGVGLVVLLLATVAFGQDPTGRTVYNEQIRIALDRQMPESRETGFDAGGWLTIAFFNYTDAAADAHRQLMQYSIRGWASFNHRGIHKVFFRGRLQYDDWADGDNPAGDPNGRGDDFDEEIERAWYQFDLGQLIALQSGQRPPVGFRLKVGRQFNTIGTALALSMRLDAIRADVTTQWVDFMFLFGNTDEESINIDTSDRIGHQDRMIFGVQATGKVGQHRPFVYFLLNDDHTDDRPVSRTQKYEYDSYYIGVGSQGELVSRLSYIAEVVFQWGDTYSYNVSSGKDNIRAWAADAQLMYRFQGAMSPRVFFEYLFASGDNDRSGSSTATTGGNMRGTQDNAFNAFGFRDTGVAFAPKISNIHMIMVGGSFFPFESGCRWVERMEFGTKVFFYTKANSGGATSDTTSTNNASWLGWEWDVYCNWRITSDLVWTARYGFFDPGTAFTTTNGAGDNIRHFFYTGVIFSF